MRWRLVMVVLGALFVVAGCGGGGSTDAGDTVEAAGIRLEKVEGEYLLAKVELDRAWYRQAETGRRRSPYPG